MVGRVENRMKIMDFLYEKKPRILEMWFKAIVETYPKDSAEFLAKKKERFSNPIGYTFASELDAIYDGILDDGNSDALLESLDRIIRIRAVQNFSAAQAVEFIFFLKDIVREVLQEEETKKEDLDAGLRALESRVDKAALKCFDIYMECSKKLYEIRASEIKNSMHMLLRRANLAI